MMSSQQQLLKVAELAFSQLADIPSFIRHLFVSYKVYDNMI
jgi:hypothetical protein